MLKFGRKNSVKSHLTKNTYNKAKAIWPNVNLPKVIRPKLIRPKVIRPEVIRPEVIRLEVIRPKKSNTRPCSVIWPLDVAVLVVMKPFQWGNGDAKFRRTLFCRHQFWLKFSNENILHSFWTKYYLVLDYFNQTCPKQSCMLLKKLFWKNAFDKNAFDKNAFDKTIFTKIIFTEKIDNNYFVKSYLQRFGRHN